VSKLFISLNNYHGLMLYLTVHVQYHVNPCFSSLFYTKHLDILSAISLKWEKRSHL